ncbi:MAG TPA: ABC transporter permease [Vicinamibacterales bacterium]
MTPLRLWRVLRRRRSSDAVLQQELSAHLEALEHEYRSQGLSTEAARQAARLRLGNVTAVREDVREEFSFGALERLAQDLRYAVRTLRANPGFAFFSVLVMALGIGATSTMFTIVHGVLLRPLPFRDPDRLVMLEEKWLPRFPRFEASPLDFLDWQQHTTSFGELAAFKDSPFTLASDDRPERIHGARVSANLPALLGVDPILGHTFTPEEDRYGSELVILVGEALWRRRFAADPSVVGKRVALNGLDYTVLGIMPSTFRFPELAEIWTPMQFTPKDLASRGNHVVWAVGRLKPGVTSTMAQAEMDGLMPRLQRVWGANVVPIADHYLGDVRRALYVLLGAAAVVLLIAAVNVAGLLVARGSSRQREIALRAALGASRGRIVQQLLTETAVIALAAGSVGVLLTYVSIDVITSLPLVGLPRLEGVTVSQTVIAFVLVVTLLTGVVFGLAPAFRISRTDLGGNLRAGGRTTGSESRTRARSALVACEVALAVVLVAGAGLLLQSLSKLLEVNTGLNAEHVLTATITLPAVAYGTPVEQVRFVESVLGRLENLPDVRAAAISTGMPFAGVEDSGIRFDGHVGLLGGTTANNYRVTPGYFRVMQIPLVRGRLLTERDTAASPPVVVINETMARRFFPDEDPVGKRLDISGPTYLREIVGVVGDVRQEGLRRPVAPQVYEAFAQKPRAAFRVAIRTAGDPMQAAATLRQQVFAVDKGLPLSDVTTMEDLIAASTTRDRMAALVLGAFAALALILAAIGIYGVIAYSIAQRTQEIGVRLALGASGSKILQLIVGQTMRLVLSGLIVGLIASIVLSKLLESLLYEVSPRDPVTLLAVSILLAGVALAAALVPAWRGLRVPPMTALRAE